MKKQKKFFNNWWLKQYENKEEIVSPYMTNWDSVTLIQLLISNKKYTPGGSLEALWNQFIRENESSIEDVYNLYYHHISYMEIDSNKNNDRFKFLQGVFNSNLKGITVNNTFYTFLFVQELIRELFNRLLEKQETQQSLNNFGNTKANTEESNKSNTDQGSTTSSSNEESLEDIFNNSSKEAQKNIINQAINNTNQQIKKLESFGGIPGNLAGNGDLSNIEDITSILHLLNNININFVPFKSFVGKLVNKSKSYFSSYSKQYYTSIFDSEDFSEIDNLELLYPPLDKINILELEAKENQYFNIFDIYIDYSWSMNSKYTFNNTRISRRELVKLLYLKLYNLKLTDHVYRFQETVKKMTSVHEVLMTSGGGGTSIDTVIRNIDRTNKPSIILTDLEDSIKIYNSKAYFISFMDYKKFSETEIGQKYLKNKQCLKMTDTTLVEVTL